MSKSEDDESNIFHDDRGCLPKKAKIQDISDSQPTPISSQNIKPTIEESVKNKYAHAITQDMDANKYKMDHKYRGVALIFNHTEFYEPSLERRNGTDKDVKVLLETLPLLGFERDNIIVENNLTKSEILNYSYKIFGTKRSVLEDCDCIAIFVLSHGSKGNKIYALDDVYDLYQLIEQYTPNNFKMMAAKPKLFFINACRGESLDAGVQLKRKRQHASNTVTDTSDNEGQQEVFSHPIHADILISMSSYHEHISFRNVQGSWYIQDLCETIKTISAENKLDTTEITELLTRTHKLIAKRNSSSDDKLLNEKKQIPNFNSALCRNLYFKPKNIN